MGYVHIPPSGYLQVKNYIKLLTLTTVATDYSLYNLTVPPFNGNLSYATLDVYIAHAEDTSGGVNSIAACNVQIKDSGGTWRNGVGISNNSIVLSANQYAYTNLWHCGYGDIAQHIESNTTYQVQCALWSCTANNIRVYVSVVLNLYLGV